MSAPMARFIVAPTTPTRKLSTPNAVPVISRGKLSAMSAAPRLFHCVSIMWMIANTPIASAQLREKGNNHNAAPSSAQPCMTVVRLRVGEKPRRTSRSDAIPPKIASAELATGGIQA